MADQSVLTTQNESDKIQLKGFETSRDHLNKELLTRDESNSRYSTAHKPVQTFDESYLSEVAQTDTDLSSKSSPKGLLTNPNNKQKKLIKHKRTLSMEKKYRKAASDFKTDFIDYLEFLVQFYKLMSRLDAAGCTLQQVFGENKMDSESELVSEMEEIQVS